MTQQNEFKLVKPDETMLEEIRSFRNKLLSCESPMDGTGPLKQCDDPEVFVRECRRGEHAETARPGFVPATQFLFVDEASREIIGMIDVRHELNDFLAKIGGHIGYCIRPSERGHGYAAEMLKRALQYCRETLHLPWVMISCNADNPASEHTIRNCGGILERTAVDPEDRKTVLIFTIPLDS